MSSDPVSMPQDILDAILVELGRANDHASLKRCSLVHRRLLTPCQKHLFATIELLRTGTASVFIPEEPMGLGVDVRGVKFHRILQANPHIASYVRNLKLYAFSHNEARWISEDIKCTEIIDLLCGIRNLELGFLPPILWSELSPALQSRLYSLLRSSQLHTLILHGLQNIPIDIVPFFGTLSSLELRRVSYTTACQSNEKIPDNRSSLKSLSISDSDPSIQLMIDDFGLRFPGLPIDLSRLSSLDIPINFVRPLFSKTLQLKTLSCSFNRDMTTPTFLEEIPINQTPHLRRLSITVKPALLRPLYSFIEGISRANQIEQVEIKCALYDDTSAALDEMEYWERLDEKALPIPSLIFRLFFRPWGDPDDHDCTENFHEDLRRRIKKGGLLDLIIHNRVKIIIHELRGLGGYEAFWNEVKNYESGRA